MGFILSFFLVIFNNAVDIDPAIASLNSVIASFNTLGIADLITLFIIDPNGLATIDFPKPRSITIDTISPIPES